jgi:hypothetical protein
MIVSDVMSDHLYQVALTFSRPFTLRDLTPNGNVERRTVAKQWLKDLIARGELKRTDTRRDSFYEWVNE